MFDPDRRIAGGGRRHGKADPPSLGRERRPGVWQVDLSLQRYVSKVI
jgi:hypothetical protein